MTIAQMHELVPGRKVYYLPTDQVFEISAVDAQHDIIYLRAPDSSTQWDVSLDTFYKRYAFVDLFSLNHWRKSLQCECGVDRVGSGKHSDYCPKYERD